MVLTDKSLKCHKDLFQVQLLPTLHHLHNILITLNSPNASVNKHDYKHDYKQRGI